MREFGARFGEYRRIDLETMFRTSDSRGRKSA